MEDLKYNPAESPLFTDGLQAYADTRYYAPPRRRCGPVLLPIVIFSLCVLYFVYSGPEIPLLLAPGASTTLGSVSDSTVTSGSNFRWSDIEPSTTLDWIPCLTSFRCARLSVPINWNASAEEQRTGPRAAVAVIKLPAKVPVTDPRYGGAIVVNPGGPGESGVYQVIAEGKYIQTIVDSPETPETGDSRGAAKYFDILSFDPRGVNNTTPKLRCFPDAFKQQAWLLRYLDFGLLWSSDSVVGYEWARASALGASCAREEADGGILRHVNTAQVVSDMVEIVEREGEWRDNEAKRIVAELKIDDAVSTQEMVRRAAYRPGKEKLQFWGMSYGTLIGSTFAALHPQRVQRLILDGVMDPADHYSGSWLTNLLDSDKIVTKFSEYCFQAGPEKCPLYTGLSPADVEARFTAILLSLKKSPIPVVLPPSSVKNAGPELVTYGDAHLYMLSSLYFTYATTEMFWDMLLALESRNATSPTLLELAAGKQERLSPAECHEDEVGISQPCIPYNSMLGPNQAINCMDTGGTTNVTLESYKEYLTVLQAQSRWISPSWGRNKIGCLGYAVQPAWKPDLTFERQEWDNTAHPLLIIGNSHDPVTPLANARRVSTIFPGSVVLQQDSEGHVSQSNPSLCTARIIREYFQSGNLPLEGSFCEPELRPFMGCIQEHGCDFEKLGQKDLWDSMVGMADPFGLRKKAVTTEGVHIDAWNHVISYKGANFAVVK